MVAPAEGVLARVPDRAALLEDDVAGDDELVCEVEKEQECQLGGFSCCHVLAGSELTTAMVSR